MKFYKRDPDRALSGMAELTLKQRGAYNSILDLLYSRDGEVPDDDRRIARMISCHWREWANVKTDLIDLGKIWIEDGMIRAKRVQETIKEAADFSQDQSKRAAKGWQKRRKYNKNNDRLMPTGNALTPIATDKDTDTNVSGADAPRSLTQIIYSDGLKLLLAGGVSEKEARSLLGMWRKQHGDPALIGALSRAQATGAIEPIRFIQGCFKNQRGEHDPLVNQGIRRLGDEDRRGNFSGGGDSDPPPRRNATNPLPGMQRDAKEEIGPLPERDVEARRDRLALLALRA